MGELDLEIAQFESGALHCWLADDILVLDFREASAAMWAKFSAGDATREELNHVMSDPATVKLWRDNEDRLTAIDLFMPLKPSDQVLYLVAIEGKILDTLPVEEYRCMCDATVENKLYQAGVVLCSSEA